MSYRLGTFEINSRQDAETILANGRDPDSRPLANNTYLERREDGTIAVRLHSTDIVSYRPNGEIILTSGGWKTVTTKDRINRFAPVNVWAEQGQWYVTNIHRREREQVEETWKDGNGNVHTIERTKTRTTSYVPFVDGMKLGPNGGLPDKDELLNKAPNGVSAKRGEIRSFVREFVKAFARGQVALPGAGDCWYCSMYEENSGKSLGEVRNASDHLQSHIDEGYYVPSLLFNALKDAGYDPKVTSGPYWTWQWIIEGKVTEHGQMMLDLYYRALYRYMLKGFGFPFSGQHNMGKLDFTTRKGE